MRTGPKRKQMYHLDQEDGTYYYTCSCPNCKYEMMWPRSMFSKNYKSKYGVQHWTDECKKWEDFQSMNKNFRYSLYRYQYRPALRRDGLPRVKLSSKLKNNLKNPEYLEFAKLFEKLDRDEKGYYLCPVYNIPLFYLWQNSKGHARSNINGPSIDRIDNNKPHTIDNIQIISTKANLHKNDATIEEMVMQGEYYKRLLKERQSFK